MAFDITRKQPLSNLTSQTSRTEFTDASATTAWTAANVGAGGIVSIRALIYAKAASAATFQLEVASDGSGTGPVIIDVPVPAISAPGAFEIKGIVPVAGKTHFRIVRGGTSATFDAVVDVV